MKTIAAAATLVVASEALFIITPIQKLVWAAFSETLQAITGLTEFALHEISETYNCPSRKDEIICTAVYEESMDKWNNEFGAIEDFLECAANRCYARVMDNPWAVLF